MSQIGHDTVRRAVNKLPSKLRESFYEQRKYHWRLHREHKYAYDHDHPEYVAWCLALYAELNAAVESHMARAFGHGDTTTDPPTDSNSEKES